MRTPLARIIIVAASLLWAVTIATAFAAIRHFETTPGEAAVAGAAWPSSTVVPRHSGEWTLVMLVHPRCSCSRASMEELEAILEKSPAVQPYVLVYRPHDARPGWERGSVLDAASRLRRVHVIIDEDGKEAKRFGGYTSGTILLYDRQARLRFAGGITSLRGHSGINKGREDVIRIATSGNGNGAHPVFGCAIEKKETR
ncbi:MAG: RedB protein [Acidobacteria bacterium]|nr:RedB protein [Acidobacteriota bacterium]MBV9478310.1 RedB protein [Acidobacteriota bacterium]